MTTSLQSKPIVPGSPLIDKIDFLTIYNCNVRCVPEHMQGAVADYVLFGLPPGGFLAALFGNDLKESFARADEANLAAMHGWVRFMYNQMPRQSQGSPTIVKDWVERGGLLRYQTGDHQS